MSDLDKAMQVVIDAITEPSGFDMRVTDHIQFDDLEDDQTINDFLDGDFTFCHIFSELKRIARERAADKGMSTEDEAREDYQEACR